MYAKEKAQLLIMLALIIGTSTIAGFYAGMRHAIVDTQVSYYAGIVTFELDGRAYEHVAEGWVNR